MKLLLLTSICGLATGLSSSSTGSALTATGVITNASKPVDVFAPFDTTVDYAHRVAAYMQWYIRYLSQTNNFSDNAPTRLPEFPVFSDGSDSQKEEQFRNGNPAFMLIRKLVGLMENCKRLMMKPLSDHLQQLKYTRARLEADLNLLSVASYYDIKRYTDVAFPAIDQKLLAVDYALRVATYKKSYMDYIEVNIFSLNEPTKLPQFPVVFNGLEFQQELAFQDDKANAAFMLIRKLVGLMENCKLLMKTGKTYHLQQLIDTRRELANVDWGKVYPELKLLFATKYDDDDIQWIIDFALAAIDEKLLAISTGPLEKHAQV